MCKQLMMSALELPLASAPSSWLMATTVKMAMAMMMMHLHLKQLGPPNK